MSNEGGWRLDRGTWSPAELPSASRAEPQDGLVYGRFIVEERVGEGAFAVVYRVRHQVLGTVHALKVLKPGPPRLVERMVQEGRLQAGLRHPNVVPVTDLIECAGSVGLLMDFVAGPTLGDWLAAHRPSVAQVDQLFTGIVRGVASAHARGIIHRDLKPGNIMLEEVEGELRARVTDFGLARKLQQDLDRTRAGVMMGTPGFMAPEQILDARSVDERADIFSLGCILYVMCTGERPFFGGSNSTASGEQEDAGLTDLRSVQEAVLGGRYTSPREHAPELPRRMLRAIDRCLQVQRSDRPPSCEALLELLNEGAADPPPPPPKAAPSSTWSVLRVRGGSAGPELATGLQGFQALDPALGRFLGAIERRSQELTRAAEPLPAALVRACEALGAALPKAKLLQVHVEGSGLAVPWELVYAEALGAGSTLVRAVPSNRPSVPREVGGPLRVLVADARGQVEEVEALKRALAGSVRRNQVDWLPELTGTEVRLGALIHRLREPPRPHLLVLRCEVREGPDGRPQLRMGPSGDDWVPVDMPALALDRRLCHELRVLVLDLVGPEDQLGAVSACASALAVDGVSAALTWSLPVRSTERVGAAAAFIDRLAGPGGGDVVEALAAARSGGGKPGSVGFCAPSLALRGERSQLFDYSERSLLPEGVTLDESPSRASQAEDGRVRRDLEGLLGRPGRTTVVLGDAIDPGGEGIGSAQLRRHLRSVVAESSGSSLAALMQVYELLEDRAELRDLVQHTLEDVQLEQGEDSLQAIDFIARLSAPGLFVTLLWLPILETALAKHHPDTRIVVLQSLRPGALNRLKSFRREPGETQWRRGDPLDLRDPDFRRDFVVLRLFGGCATPGRGVHGDPVLTENDLLEQLAGLDGLPDPLLAQYRRYPVCTFGIHPSNWAHREVMRRLAGPQPMATNSLAVLPADPAEADRRYWQWDRGPAGGPGRVQTIDYADFMAAAYL